MPQQVTIIESGKTAFLNAIAQYTGTGWRMVPESLCVSVSKGKGLVDSRYAVIMERWPPHLVASPAAKEVTDEN